MGPAPGCFGAVTLDDAIAASPQLAALLGRLHDRVNAQTAQIDQLTRLNEGLQRQLAQAITGLAQATAANAGRASTPETRPTTAPEPLETPATQEAEDIAADVAAHLAQRKAASLARRDRRRKKKKGPRAGQKPKRRPLPDDIERQVEPVDLPSCPKCDSDDLYALTPEVSERLHYVPARVVVRQLVRAKVRCRACEAFSTAPLPPTAVPGGQMTAAFLAHIVYSKCGLHLPLARIIEDLGRQGIDLAMSTACDAMGHAADLLDPIVDRLTDQAFAGDVLQLDGTGLDVLLPGESGKVRGQMTVCCNEAVSLYVFSETKHGRHFADFLRIGSDRSYRGYLVVDAASNMNLLFTDGAITKCGCWQHARERFVSARASSPFKAEEGIAWIATLFDLEHDAEAAGETTEQRLARRKRYGPARLSGFEQWMAKTLPTVAPDEDLARAIRYCQRHWAALKQFLADGCIPLTNNLSERELGVIGRGRKNYLFAGSDIGGRRLATLYTVVRTCQRMEIDAFAYLAWVLPRLSDLPVNRVPGVLPTLLPGAFKKAGEQAPAG
jgi:transposase